MTGKCSNPDCAAPISCHEGKEKHTECEFWVKSNAPQSKTKVLKKRKIRFAMDRGSFDYR